MRRRALLFTALLLLDSTAHALVFDTVISGMRYAKEQAYEAFMRIKMIEQIRLLKENYDVSVRYYNEFRRLNSGRGLVYNVANQFKTAGHEMGYELQAQLDRDFVHTYKSGTEVDKFFRGIDNRIAANMRYAGDEMANLISQRNMGIDIARNAQGLSPKDAANLSLKAQGLQLQMAAQLHEDNLRLIEIQTMRLANENRRALAENSLIEELRDGLARRARISIPADKR